MFGQICAQCDGFALQCGTVAPWHPFVIGKASVCGSTEERMQKKAQYAKTSAAALKVV